MPTASEMETGEGELEAEEDEAWDDEALRLGGVYAMDAYDPAFDPLTPRADDWQPSGGDWVPEGWDDVDPDS